LSFSTFHLQKNINADLDKMKQDVPLILIRSKKNKRFHKTRRDGRVARGARRNARKTQTIHTLELALAPSEDVFSSVPWRGPAA
jgi:hypothetical protein